VALCDTWVKCSGSRGQDRAIPTRAIWTPRRSKTFVDHTVARNSNVDNVVHYVKVARAGRGKGFMHRWKVGLAPTEPAYRKRRRRALAAQRKARRREHGIVAELSRSERSVRTATLPLEIGPALIVILLLSLGSWAIIWAAIELALAALG
jgi:hypothetical protein